MNTMKVLIVATGFRQEYAETGQIFADMLEKAAPSGTTIAYLV